MARKDPELVGEFLHCLRVLGRPLSAGQQTKVARAREFLAGPHDVRRATFYKRYHTAWCVAVGLGA